MNPVYQSLINLFPTLLGDTTVPTGAGPATPAALSGADNSWSFLRTAIPFAIPVLPIGYGVYKLFSLSRTPEPKKVESVDVCEIPGMPDESLEFREAPTEVGDTFNPAENLSWEELGEEIVDRGAITDKKDIVGQDGPKPRTSRKEIATKQILIARDVRVTVGDDGSVTVRNIETGVKNAPEISLKPGDSFQQGEYVYTLKTDGGMYLEGKSLYNPYAKSFQFPLRSTESGHTDLIDAKYDAMTVTEIQIPKADIGKALTERPQKRGDLTKGRENRPLSKSYEAGRGFEVVEAKTTEFEAREAMKTGKFKAK